MPSLIAIQNDRSALNRPIQNTRRAENYSDPNQTKVQNWCLTINNPDQNVTQILSTLVPTHAQYIIYGNEHRGSKPLNWPQGLLTRNNELATWTNHYQVYIQMNKRVEPTVFKKLLKIKPHYQPASGTVEQNQIYVSKGDLFEAEKYLNLPQELNNFVINPPLVVEFGTPNRPNPRGGSSNDHSRAEKTKKRNLLTILQQHPTAQSLVIADPQLYSRYRNGIKDYYNALIALKPCKMPIIEWHFGETRSGKTFAGYALTGGKMNPDCHYQQGDLEWITNYRGQTIMFLNEYRCSSKAAFTMLLTIMEGYPADLPYKGGFVPVRIDLLVITCPRPPAKLDCEMFGYRRFYEGEFASVNRYSEQHEQQAWEDVAQVTERIRESGGHLVAHARNGPEGGPYEYTSCTIIGNQITNSQLLALDPMSQMLAEVNSMLEIE